MSVSSLYCCCAAVDAAPKYPLVPIYLCLLVWLVSQSHVAVSRGSTVTIAQQHAARANLIARHICQKPSATFHQIPSQKGDQNPAAFPTTWYTRSKPRVANPTFSKPGQRFERERGTRRRETRLFACDSLGASKRMSSQLLSLTFESLFFFSGFYQ